MKVKEYLVNRILELESNIMQARNDYAGVSRCLELQKNKINELNELLEQYQIDREHIKEIIACNISDGEIKLIYSQCDYTTLLSILDIKPDDYTEPRSYPICKFYEVPNSQEPCNICKNRDKFELKEATTDAETEGKL